MFKFFRKIRKRLLSENKFSKYLIYAIGEIVLLVIGIMIALYFNNKNQQRIEEEKIKVTLAEIQRDIVSDINYSNYFIGRYIKRDSIKNIILNNQLTYDDLKSGKVNADYAAFYRDEIVIQTNGFEQFVKKIDVLPEKYNDLLTMLNELYKVQKFHVEFFVEQYQEGLSKNIDHSYYNTTWYAHYNFTNSISDEQIDFYLHNPMFKNYVMRLSSNAFSLFMAVTSYRVKSIQVFYKIQELLGNESFEITNDIRNTSLKTTEEANRFIGEYQLVSGPDNTVFGNTLEITNDGKQLFVSSGRRKNVLLFYWDIDKPEFIISRAPVVLRFDSIDNSRLSIIHGKMDNTHWIKAAD